MTDRTQSDLPHRPKLSICIATYKRASFIADTLRSIAPQLTPEVELVIVDGASPDDTAAVVERVAARHPTLHYYRESDNSGVDRDYDKAVAYATGEYCWLMTDDDFIVSGAVARVLNALGSSPDLVVLNTEILDADLTKKLDNARFKSAVDLAYDESKKEEFFVRMADHLSFIGAVVIRRSLWMQRDRAPYLGTLFVHIGVIFQTPAIGNAKVIAQPLIKIRYGNAMWTTRGFEIWTFKWPALVWSFNDFSESAKQAVCPREPWRRFRYLMLHRALGTYSIDEFQKYLRGVASGWTRLIAWLAARCPGVLANFTAVIYVGLFNRSARVTIYDILRSRHASRISRLAARTLAIET